MSAFTWIDHSEKQRRQVLEAIDMFREKDTRDELGLAGIRDTFSDMLFPGTGSLQTRARYFFFVPWMYLGFEAGRVPSSEVARKGRAFEIALIDRLAESPDSSRTIGIRARSELQRLPSSVYWNGLKVLGICQSPGSQADYHRSLDRRLASSRAVRVNDDGEAVGVTRAWHASIPAAPPSFPEKASFALTTDEARYFKGRVLENHRPSLFAFMLNRDYVDSEAPFAWNHQASQDLPSHLHRELDHAQCFSEVMHGASVLYNLYLGEMDPRREKVVEDCEAVLVQWLKLLSDRRGRLAQWNQDDIWKLLYARQYVPSVGTKAFADEWFRRVLNEDPARLRGATGTRELIFSREAQVKGALARCTNRRSREMWNGEAGLGRFDFRWSNARILLQDIAAGLAGGRA
jgi:hypothetical protein